VWTDANDELAMTSAEALSLTPIGELLAETEEECAWVVDGLLPAGGLSLIAGKPKAGKSTAARCLALAVARGEPWLGLATLPGTVFYLGFEEKRGEVRAHFRRMGARSDDPVRVLIGKAPNDALRRLRAAVEQLVPALIVVDTVARLVRVRDWNDYAVVTTALEPLLALARETGAAVLLVHHAGKGERSGADAILGSTAILAAVDTALLIKRSERYRTLSSQQRYGEDLEELTITLDRETGWLTRGVPREEADDMVAGHALVAFLTRQPDPVEEPTIHEAVPGRKAVKERALRRLVGEQKVARSGAGRRGDPFRYSLPPTYTTEGERRNDEHGTSAQDGEPDSRFRGDRLLAPVSEPGEGESEHAEEVNPWAER
jgi:hypothetical protein